MSIDELFLAFALFLLIEVTLLIVAAPMLRSYHTRGQLGRAVLFVSVCGVILAILMENTVAALMVAMVLQP